MGTGVRRAALAAALAVLTLASLAAITWLRVPEPTTEGRATLDGLTAQLLGADWVPLDHVHDGDGGFLMPDEMMPGAPSGDEVRLGINLTLTNTTSATQEFNLGEEFTIIGGLTTEPGRMRADSIGELPRLAPGSAIDGTIYFDIEVPDEQADPPLYLQWDRDGEMVRFAVPLSDQPAHEHG